MKKITAALTIIALFTLTSCSGISSMNPDKLKIDKAYKFTVDIQYDEFSASGQFERIAAGMWEITMTAPFALEGMTMTYSNGHISSQYEQMSAVMSDDSVAMMIIAAFENAVDGEGREIISTKEEIRITSRAGNPARAYELILDKKSLTPLSLKIADAKLSAEFSQVQISQIVHVLIDYEQMQLETAAVTPEETFMYEAGLIPHD
jgi:hypothetical protein